MNRSERKILAAMLVFLFAGLVFLFSSLDRKLPPTPPPHPAAAPRATHGEPRSSCWRKARQEYMDAHPEGCAVCGSKVDPQIHHVIPFHVDEKLQCDQSNLIWLCGPGHESHHLIVGHAGNYRGHNPHVREDAALLKSRYEESKRLAEK